MCVWRRTGGGKSHLSVTGWRPGLICRDRTEIMCYLRCGYLRPVRQEIKDGGKRGTGGGGNGRN